MSIKNFFKKKLSKSITNSDLIIELKEYKKKLDYFLVHIILLKNIHEKALTNAKDEEHVFQVMRNFEHFSNDMTKELDEINKNIPKEINLKKIKEFSKDFFEIETKFKKLIEDINEENKKHEIFINHFNEKIDFQTKEANLRNDLSSEIEIDFKILNEIKDLIKKIDTLIEKINNNLQSRRKFLKQSATIAAGTVLGLTNLNHLQAENLNFVIYNDYSSWNSRRPNRRGTSFIILHTTEANDQSSLNSVKNQGLANYLLKTNGEVVRIIHRDKISRHAGRSMWDGLTNLDNYSIGIEIVGYHNKNLTNEQIIALKELLRQLKNIYNIQDERIMPHSMVAYGSPNRWHSYNHRGRKRCAMFLANEGLRKQIGLGPLPNKDPDVIAGRLRVADNELNEILFAHKTIQESISIASVGNVITNGVTAWTIARNQFNSPTTVYNFPNGKRKKGSEILNWNEIPNGTKVSLDVGEEIPDDIEFFQTITGDDTAWKIAGREYNSKTTIYFFPDKTIRRGDELTSEVLNNLPRETEVLTGYIYGGRILKDRSAYQIVGNNWNHFSTFYRLPNAEILSGEDINQNNIPLGTIVLFRSNN